MGLSTGALTGAILICGAASITYAVIAGARSVSSDFRLRMEASL